MVRKLTEFLKDDSATVAIEYAFFAAGLTVVVITAVKPAKLSPACPTCGLPMHFVTAIAKFSLHPQLRTYKCRICEKTAMEEWEPGKGGSTWQHFFSGPIVHYLPLNRRGDRIVDLEPMIDTAGLIGRGSPLRSYALAVERARALVDDSDGDRKMPIKWNGGMRVAKQLLEDALAFLDRVAAQIIGIDFKRIECAWRDRTVTRPPPDHFKHCRAALIADDGFAVDLAGSDVDGAYRGSSTRVSCIEVEVGSGDEPHADSITPRQMMRKPSLLIS
jgi:Flp pilus assembly pilin Flp